MPSPLASPCIRHLNRLLIDQNPFEIEGLFDRLFRATMPYGRKGIALLNEKIFR